jgi:hypothetical protein
MSINIPPLPRAINKIILDFTQANVLPYDKIIQFFFPSFNEDDNDPLNDFFDESGFGSKLIISNLGSTFIYLIISIPLFFVTLSIKKSRCFKKW